MSVYLLRRFAMMLVTFFGITLVVFTMTRVIPADPARAAAGVGASPQTVAMIRHELGLDRPLLTQYLFYMRDLSRGSLGKSVYSRKPVTTEVLRYLPATIELAMTSFLVLCLVGIPLGILAATHRGHAVDVVTRIAAVGSTALPIFWLALILQFIFFYHLHWFPIIGRSGGIALRPEHITGFYVFDALITWNWPALVDTLRHMFLPLVTLVASRLAVVVRLTRVCVLEVLSEDYVRTARAKGVPNSRIVYKHVLRNAAGPIVTELGMQLAWMLGGSAVAEAIFVWPGLAYFALLGMASVDYNVIMAFTLVFALIFLLSNLLVDVICALLNPKIRLE